MIDNDTKTCFYCGCLLSNGNIEYDHVPIPKEYGGQDTVPSCISCHDMKDRFLLEDWPDAWKLTVEQDFDRLRRETKIWIAILAKQVAKILHDQKI